RRLHRSTHYQRRREGLQHLRRRLHRAGGWIRRLDQRHLDRPEPVRDVATARPLYGRSARWLRPGRDVRTPVGKQLTEKKRGAVGRLSSLRKLSRMAIASPAVVRVDRGYVEVSGPDAEDFLERMLSNEVTPLEVGSAVQALLLTPKGRIIAP